MLLSSAPGYPEVGPKLPSLRASLIAASSEPQLVGTPRPLVREIFWLPTLDTFRTFAGQLAL